MMKRMTLTNRTLSLALVLCISALTVTVAAQKSQNVYDKFRNRNLTNDGLLSEAEEMKLGDEVHKQLLNPPRQDGVQEKDQPQPLRLIQGTTLDAYINDIGQRLARTSKRPNIPWRFYVVDDKAVNAFATLGGHVYIHTGLIAQVRSEAQLVSVIGHEIGHIVGRHGLENVKKANSIKAQGPVILGTILGAVLGGEGGAQLGNMAGSLLGGSYLMKHSKDAEREADYLGVYNMERAGYNTGGMTEMFGILAEISKGGGGNLFGSILASHPDPRERAQNTEVEIGQYLRASNQRGTQTTDNFQRIKNGLPAISSTSGPTPAGNRNTRPRDGGSSTAPTIRRRPRP